MTFSGNNGVRSPGSIWRYLLAGLCLLLSACGGEPETTMELGVTLLRFSAEPEPDPEPEEPVEVIPIAEELVPCSEVPAVVPTGDTTANGAVDMDSDLIAVLAAYGEANPETFAGLWLDGESSGGLLLAFTDEPGSHTESIMNSLGGDSWSVPFSVALVPFSEQALNDAVRVTLGRRIPSVLDGSVDLKKNRVALDLLDPTDEDLETLTELSDLTQVCINVAVSPPLPDGPLEVLPQAGGSSLLTCDEYPFPAAALEQPITIADSDHPAVAVLDQYTDGDPDWIVLSAESDHALFGKYDDGLKVTALAEPNDEVWEIAGWTFGCDLKVGLPVGHGPVEIFNDPDSQSMMESDSDQPTISVLVAEIACAGGQPMGRRLLGPQVVETDTQVILAFAAADQVSEAVGCPSNPMAPVQVTLSEPLGTRTVVDGMHLPPRPIRDP